MSENVQEKKSIKALFIDLDTVLMNTNTQEPLPEMKKGPEGIRNIYLKYRIRDFEKDEFLQLTDDELLIMETWSYEWTDHLSRMFLDLTVYVYSKTPFNPDHMVSMCKFKHLHIAGFFHCKDQEALMCAVHDTMADQEDKDRYFVISREDLHEVFPDHAMKIKPLGETDGRELEITLRRVLCTDPQSYFSWHTSARGKTDREREIFYKVIFLDIDGVLNDEGETYDQGVIVDHEMVACLKSIVDRTGAQIILSSSWKYAYMRFVEDHFKTTDKHLIMLQEAFDKYGIKVSGITPLSNASGPNARPLEIHEWLKQYDKIFSYVILDDDTFWTWGFLQRNVVTTQTYVPGSDEYHPYVKGLTMELADKAVAILNDQGAMIRKI